MHVRWKINESKLEHVSPFDNNVHYIVLINAIGTQIINYVNIFFAKIRTQLEMIYYISKSN